MVAFALLSDVLKPKAFSGVFSAAPSVALASLSLTTVMTGSAKAAESSLAMVAGAIGLIAFCTVAALLEKKTGAITGSAVAWVSWFVAAGIAFWVLFL